MPAEEDSPPDYSGSVMVALYPPAQVAQELSVEGGLPAEELHITLCYLGDDLAVLDRPAIESALKEFASGRSPVESVANGVGMFHVTELDGAEDDQFAQILLLDIPGINEFREDLRSGLLDAGTESYENHGFTPHMTLAYRPEAPQELDEPPMTEISFGSVWLAWGDERIEYPLKAVTASSISQVDTLTDSADGTAAAKVLQADASGRRWRGVLTVEGMQTGDGRVIAEGAIEWADLPLPLNWLKDGNNHAPGTGAPQVGIIESIVREGNEIIGEGVFDEGSPDALEVIRQMQEGVAPGGTRFFVSIDPDDWEVELVAPEGVDDLDEIMLIGSGFTPKLRAWWGRVQRWMIRAAAGEDDPEDAEVVMESAADELIERATRMRIRGATLCTISAFDGAWIELTDEGAPVEKLPEPVEEVLASAYPTKPPTAWFHDPGLQELQRFVTVEDGRIYGHLAGWNECHLSYPEICLDPPASEHDYAYFHIGRVKTEEGELVETGPIALKGGHAGLGLDYRAAQAHYDDPATGIADVRVGPDEYGIWFSGALRPDATEEDIRCLRASGVSGDWRRVGAGPELIGICSVNVPGYPKVMARVASGELLALVAAGGRPEADDGQVFGKIQERFGSVEKVLLPMALGELDKRVLKAIDRRVSQ